MIPHSRKEHGSKRDLDHLESAIQALKVAYDKFFNGANPLPPEDLRTKIQQHLRSVRSQPTQAFADRFRLNTLEARFNVLCELYNRRLRDLEKTARHRHSFPAGTERFDPFAGIDLDGTGNRDAVEALYHQLYRSSGRPKKIDFNSFQQYLDSQIDQVRAKTGCKKVQFRVTGEGERMKLKAKPVRRSRHGEEASS